MNVERVGDVVYSDYRRIIGVEEEEVPTHLNTNDTGPYLVVSADNLFVKYIGRGRSDYDVGSLQANCPAPIKKLLYYFEMYVENKGRRGKVSIGFTDQQFNKHRQPGWETHTFGYHGDDGKVFHDSGHGMRFGPTYTTGDTVGAGINKASQDVFFTKNGKFIGSITRDYEGVLFPTVGLHSPDEGVVVNFGQQEFVFNIQGSFGEM
ncbi:ran-binding protein M homolog isoform X2 [Cryptomeria japonica]|uniref:ran-binding protein M homolog isoform X2 n=1 Tax=Cryptomeria japonica TaxID=3369 RepID=UPI0025ACBF2D|nr:ran-binding protein M homolog isoform X2 [Cryptomeria japonica]